MNPPLRVILVDDDEDLLTRLATNLQRRSDIQVTALFTDGLQLLKLLDNSPAPPADVVLLDVEMPKMAGPAVASSILERNYAVPIVMYTAFRQPQSLGAAVRAGVRGFLTKDTPIDDLADALHRAAGGETVMSPQPTAILTEAFRAQLIQREEDAPFELAVAELPQALREVFDRLTLSESNAEIARRTNLKVSTVKDYVSKVLERTGCRSRSHLILRAAKAGLTCPD